MLDDDWRVSLQELLARHCSLSNQDNHILGQKDDCTLVRVLTTPAFMMNAHVKVGLGAVSLRTGVLCKGREEVSRLPGHLSTSADGPLPSLLLQNKNMLFSSKLYPCDSLGCSFKLASN